ncbi:MAG: hypothetical protein BWX72_01510 [Firmicutes bacterium ADurb.Bin080]|nr:MAG: hypothetical protein BWX72_01510 [Firmicutes bacterium ADurb.Bin080]
MKTIVTADDFGLSPGINKVIIDLLKQGNITQTSILMGSYFTEDAINLFKSECPDKPLGIHLSLTFGKKISSYKLNLLSSKDFMLRLTYPKLLFLLLNPLTRLFLLSQVEKEFEAQILKLKTYNIPINHIDSHQHVHMIPGIFKIVKKLAVKYRIENIRHTNESFFITKSVITNNSSCNISGIIKHIIISCFTFFASSPKDSYFFSILHSCKIKPGLIDYISFQNLSKKYNSVEIMVHPGLPELDLNHISLIDKREIKQALSSDRLNENEALIEISNHLLFSNSSIS